MSPDPASIGLPKPRKGKLKFLADTLRPYSTILGGAAIVTPTFTGHAIGGINVVWAVVSLLILAIAFVLTPEE